MALRHRGHTPTLVQSPQAADRFVGSQEAARIECVRYYGFLDSQHAELSRLIWSTRICGSSAEKAIALSFIFENTPRISVPTFTSSDNVGEVYGCGGPFGFLESRFSAGSPSRSRLDAASSSIKRFLGTRALIVA